MHSSRVAAETKEWSNGDTKKKSNVAAPAAVEPTPRSCHESSRRGTSVDTGPPADRFFWCSVYRCHLPPGTRCSCRRRAHKGQIGGGSAHERGGERNDCNMIGCGRSQCAVGRLQRGRDSGAPLAGLVVGAGAGLPLSAQHSRRTWSGEMWHGT